MPKFIYGSFMYEYSLVRQERKTLSLTVKPDLSIILKAPQQATDERIEQFLKKKWLWLEKNLRSFKKYQRKYYKKEYVTGESFLYLGRQYKLHVQRAHEEEVLLHKHIMELYTVNKITNTACNERLIKNWYVKQRGKILHERFQQVLTTFEYSLSPELVMRTMRKRWGSYVSNEKIYLNPNLIYVATDCIDYVITHELCHLQFSNHDKKFYQLLNKKYPRWEKVKEKLELYII